MNPTVYNIEGKIHRRKFYSELYREAALNGYEGTQEAWLESIDVRIKAGEPVMAGELAALMDYKRSMRFMKKE
jgi:hypothetical protein